MLLTSRIIITILILFSSLFYNCEEIDGIANYFSDQRNAEVVLKEELTLKPELGKFFYGDQVFTGVSTTYYKSGIMAEKTTYKNGKKHGVHQKWFDDSSLSFEANYKSNRLHGTIKSWWSNGNIRSESNYVDGKSHGVQKQWYDSGEKFKEFRIVNGKEEGLQKAWRRNGKIYVNYEAKNGRIYGLKRATLCYELDDEEILYNE